MISFFTSYPRYVYRGGISDSINDYAWRFPSYDPQTRTHYISTYNKSLWTDPYQLVPMVFCYLPDENNTINDEEIIIDSKRDISVKIDGVNVCQYTMIVQEQGENIWPWSSTDEAQIRMI